MAPGIPHLRLRNGTTCRWAKRKAFRNRNIQYQYPLVVRPYVTKLPYWTPKPYSNYQGPYIASRTRIQLELCGQTHSQASVLSWGSPHSGMRVLKRSARSLPRLPLPFVADWGAWRWPTCRAIDARLRLHSDTCCEPGIQCHRSLSQLA